MNKSEIINNYVQKLKIDLDTTCVELCDYRDGFSTYVKKEFGNANGFSGITEHLLVIWFKEYYKHDNNIVVLNETKYPALIGNQKIDIPIVTGDQILYGISVKARSETSGYLDGADFSNPLIDEYKHYLKPKSVKTGRIGVPTFLQDMARIENLNSAQAQRFNSMTIIYDKLNKKNIEWVSTFSNRYNHKYIFLLEEKSVTLKQAFEREFEGINR